MAVTTTRDVVDERRPLVQPQAGRPYMIMSSEPVPFWIKQFSEPEFWRRLAAADQAAMVLDRFPDETIATIALRLPCFAIDERRTSLPHLLRYWATSRLRHAEIDDDFLSQKETRKRVSALRRAILEASGKFRALSDQGLTMLSRELDGPNPVGQAYGLLIDFIALADRVVTASDQALTRKVRPGAQPKDELVFSIDSLAEIYRYLTGLEPTRTADPVSGGITGAFVEFARACLKAYDAKVPNRYDWSIRRALEQRTHGENRAL